MEAVSGAVRTTSCEKKIDDLPHTQKKGNAWSGVRTHADKRPADLKSAPLDPSGIQARHSPRAALGFVENFGKK